MIPDNSGAGKVNAPGILIQTAAKKIPALAASAIVILLVLIVRGIKLAGAALHFLFGKMKEYPAFTASLFVHIILLILLGLVNPNGKHETIVLTEVALKDLNFSGDDDLPPGSLGEGFRNPRPIKSVSPSEVNTRTQQVVEGSKVSGTGTDTSGTGGGGTGGGGLVVNLPVQEPEVKPVDNVYRSAVEEMPEPYGGTAAITSRVTYPETARESNIRGTVYVLAFIDENGFVRRALLSKGIGGGCDEVAVAAVRKTRFIAGKHKGEQVKVQMLIAVEFPPR